MSIAKMCKKQRSERREKRRQRPIFSDDGLCSTTTIIISQIGSLVLLLFALD